MTAYPRSAFLEGTNIVSWMKLFGHVIKLHVASRFQVTQQDLAKVAAIARELPTELESKAA